MPPVDEWTTAHDVALLYSGLACVDRELTDEEVGAIQELLGKWIPSSADTTPKAVVREAGSALKQSQQEVRAAVRRMEQTLDPGERRDTLRDLLRIAQADGVLLGAERELIHHVATAWNLKHLGGEEDAPSSALEGRRGEDWSLIYELAFLFAQVGQGDEEDPDADTLAAMTDRLREWQSEADDEAVRPILRRAFQAWADRTGKPPVRESVRELNQALSPVQRLLVLDDLYAILRAQGPPTADQRRRLRALAEAWGSNIRLETD